LLDNDVSGDWHSEEDFDYQIETSQDFFSNNSWQSRKVVENRTRWEPRVGQVKRHYDNIALQATSDYQKLLDLIGNYHLKSAIPFEPNYFKDTDIRIPDIQPENVWQIAKSILDKTISDDCRRAANAQYSKDFLLRATYGSCNWTQLMLPIFITLYLLSHLKKINHETHQIREHYGTKTNLIEQHAYFASFYIIFFVCFEYFVVK